MFTRARSSLLCIAIAGALAIAGCSGSSGTAGTSTATPSVSISDASPSPTISSATAKPQPSASPVSGQKLGTSSGAKTTTKAPDFVALPGAKASFGTLGNAVYQVEIPDSWNGELVMYAHGFAGFGTQVAVDPPPAGMRKALIENGYAWAASSFSENGYTPGIGADDTLALKQLFVKDHGAPKRTYLVGASMGGNVVTLSLEHYADAYDGALSVCGAVAGESQIDYLMSWAAVGEYTSGVTLPVGQGGDKMAAALRQQMSPALGSPENPTAKGKQFIDIIRNLTGGPRPYFLQGLADQYITNFGLLLLDPNRQTLAGKAATTQGVVYHISDGLGLTDAQVNSGIRRFDADPEARSSTHPDAEPTSGKITKPLLTLHGTGDLFVPISQEIAYRKAVEAAGAGNLLVQRAIRSAGHCKFSDQELTTAFTDLVSWVKDGKKPKGDDLFGDLSDIGKQFTNPLRPDDPGTK